MSAYASGLHDVTHAEARTDTTSVPGRVRGRLASGSAAVQRGRRQWWDGCPDPAGGPLEGWTLAPDPDRFRTMDPRAIVGAALDTIEGYSDATNENATNRRRSR
jgi:hypothetical protein